MSVRTECNVKAAVRLGNASAFYDSRAGCKLVYVPQKGEDSLVVLDASLLANKQPALITKIATGRVPKPLP
jgi:hypothetical protein